MSQTRTLSAISKCFFSVFLFFLGPLSHASDVGNYRTIGNVLALGLPVVAAGISYANDDAAGLWQLAKSEAATLAVTGALKYSINETRPNGSDNQSFPSGHTAIAFSAAQYMQMRGGWEYGVPAYLTAALVGYSRVKAREHYWKDVGAGALIGVAASYYFTDKRESYGFNLSVGQKSAYATYSTSW